MKRWGGGGGGREKNREREREAGKGVGGCWREITRVFVVVCWSSPGYEPFIASHSSRTPPPHRQIVLRDGVPTLFMDLALEKEKETGVFQKLLCGAGC